MLDANKEKGVEAAERILKSIAKHTFEYNSRKFKVTLSLGVAALGTAMKNFDDLFEGADQATYQAK